MIKTDSDKLRYLAKWIDVKYPNDLDPEVQRDLRRIANKLASLEDAIKKIIPEIEGITYTMGAHEVPDELNADSINKLKKLCG